MNFLYLAIPALSLGLLGCKTPTYVEAEYSCHGQEQTIGSYLENRPQKTINTSYPIEIDFHIRADKVLVKTYIASIVSNTDEKLVFSIDAGNNWLKGEFIKMNRSLSLITRQTLPMESESLHTQLTGQYTCQTH